MPDATVRGVIYARFSTEMQREESIDAQIRAGKEFARARGITLVSTYIDRAKSATSDDRPEFQKMIADAACDFFDVVIVHKLDRFARSRYDSAHYKYQLRKSGVQLLSVTENLDGSPESIVLESVLEGMAEYYSKNLAREVEKGKRENALQGKHVGGVPPLGYDLDRVTMKLVINEWEAQAVKLIFELYVRGHSYSEIIQALNKKGYRTKRGRPFGKGSLYEILRNEKYTGTYLYNRSSSRNIDGGFNRHRHKSESEIIRIEGAVPEIIGKELFEKVQHKMSERRHKAGRYTSKQQYLLTGKVICGECGSHYVGNSRRPREDHPLYISYRCGRGHGAVECSNSEIKRDELEKIVLEHLAEELFHQKSLPLIIEKYNTYVQKRDGKLTTEKASIERRLAEIEKGIANIVAVVMQTGSTSLSDQLLKLEDQKSLLRHDLFELDAKMAAKTADANSIEQSFFKAKEKLSSGRAAGQKAIIDQFVQQVVVHKDHLEIVLNIAEDFVVKESYSRS